MKNQILTLVNILLLNTILVTSSSFAKNSNQNNLSIPKDSEKMIVVKVTYTVNENYVNENKEMIQKFLTDFKTLDSTQFLYTILQTEDKKTFIHISQYTNEDIQQVLLNTPSFLHFQEQRDKNLASEPKIEVLNFIGASQEVL